MDLTNTIDMKYIKALYISVERVSGYLPIVWNDSWCISRSFLQGIYEKKEVIHLTYIDSKATQQRWASLGPTKNVVKAVLRTTSTEIISYFI